MIGTHGKLLQQILPLVVFGGLWYMLIKHLSVYWAVDPQYSFGWFGPVICSYLLFIRWITRPQTGQPPSQGAEWVFWIAFGTFTYLAGSAAKSRLATDLVATDARNCYTLPLRDLFRGRKIVA